MIQQHKAWLESSDHRAVSAADPSPRHPPGLSRESYIRQRLAIHSLLRQSDFVDDSREAAPDPPTEPALSWTASTEEDHFPEPQMDWNARDAAYPMADAMTTDPNLLFGLPYGGASLDFNSWTGTSGTDELGNFLGGFNEQYMY